MNSCLQRCTTDGLMPYSRLIWETVLFPVRISITTSALKAGVKVLFLGIVVPLFRLLESLYHVSYFGGPLHLVALLLGMT